MWSPVRKKTYGVSPGRRDPQGTVRPPGAHFKGPTCPTLLPTLRTSSGRQDNVEQRTQTLMQELTPGNAIFCFVGIPHYFVNSYFLSLPAKIPLTNERVNMVLLEEPPHLHTLIPPVPSPRERSLSRHVWSGTASSRDGPESRREQHKQQTKKDFGNVTTIEPKSITKK